jgi:hypothetical protein
MIDQARYNAVQITFYYFQISSGETQRGLYVKKQLTELKVTSCIHYLKELQATFLIFPFYIEDRQEQILCKQMIVSFKFAVQYYAV